MQIFFIILLIILGIASVVSITLAISKRKKVYWTSMALSTILLVVVALIFYNWNLNDQSYKSGDYEGAGASVESSSIPQSVIESNKAEADGYTSEDNSDTSSDEDLLLTLDDGTDVEKINIDKYSPDLTDTSWNNSKLHISKAYVAETNSFDFEDNTYDCVIGIKYTYTAGTDTTLFDGQSKLSTSAGQEALSALDMPVGVEKYIDEIDSGVSKDGQLFFFVPKYSKLSSIRWKFRAENNSDDQDSDWKNYDITIPLEEK